MQSLKSKLEAFQRSRVGLFVKKVMDDQAPNLAALLAWGTLSAILPLILGVLSVAGLVLRDPQRLDQVYNTLLVLVPSQTAGPLGDALQSVRQASAAPAGIVAILLLLSNGSGFFSNMASVFDQAYHVESRNFLMQRVVAVAMLMITTVLVVIATLAAGLTSVIGTVPLGLPIGPVLGQVLGWSISIVSAFLFFLLIYKVLPNAKQGWRDVLPGTLLSAVLLLVISQIFPLYVIFFPPNHAYAVFGVFLVFTFWLYLLGFILVLGAELNAFLQEPARSVALAEATAAAQHGQAAYDRQTGKVRAEAIGSAPAMTGGGALGAPTRSPTAQVGEQDQNLQGAPARARLAHASAVIGDEERPRSPGPSFAGRVLGFIGLLIAVIMLRGRTTKADERATV
jgi:membrane protein